MAVQMVTPQVKASKRKLRLTFSGIVSAACEIIRSRICFAPAAKPMPTAPPAVASPKLSVSSCRMIRARPSACRTANSRARAVERASSRLAMFAHAMSRTSATMP